MIIGAGILGIPYVVAKAGFWTGILVIITIGFATLLMNLYVGEISLRTKKSHQLTGYANKYLGKKGNFVMIILFVLGMYGAMVAYIIKGGEFLYEILSPALGGTPVIYSTIFFIIGSIIVYIGLKAIEESDRENGEPGTQVRDRAGPHR